MFNVDNFIGDNITFRRSGMFVPDIAANSDRLRQEVEGKSLLVIGGVGSTGFSYIETILPSKPSKLVAIDLNKNGLAELTCDLRSTYGLRILGEYRAYTLNFVDPIFERMFRKEQGFDIVANFSTHKHVRNEKDEHSIQVLIENNVIKAKRLFDLLSGFLPRHFFCVSTDKVANPVNIMGASKRIMEDMIMAYSSKFKVTTTRFTNVAFSNGSLSAGFIGRTMKKQPLAAPNDVERYSVPSEESSQICMPTCVFRNNGEIFFPKSGGEKMVTFFSTCDRFLRTPGHEKKECATDEEARRYAAEMANDSRIYSVAYSGSDTTGEKGYEEFYMPGERLNLERLSFLGVIENISKHPLSELDSSFDELEPLFALPDRHKSNIVTALKRFLSNSEHVEKGENLDQKM